MKHVVLAGIEIEHPFYADGACPDVEIEPTDETSALLRSRRCLLRTHATGARVLAPVGGDQRPFVPPPVDVPLRFHLRVRRDEFALFTDLAALRAVRAPVFTSAGSVDGALVLTSGGQLPPGVLAAVELRLAGDLAPRPYRAVFPVRRARWAYYCVTDLAANGGSLRIVDAAPPDPLRFEEQPDPADPIGNEIAGRHPGLRCLRFVSDRAVACSEVPRRSLELRRGDERVAGPLPNPPLGNAARPDLLFQTIRFQAHPFQPQAP